MVVVDKVDGGGTMWGPGGGTFVFSVEGRDIGEYKVGILVYFLLLIKGVLVIAAKHV